jgi:hypothetical protein
MIEKSDLWRKGESNLNLQGSPLGRNITVIQT